MKNVSLLYIPLLLIGLNLIQLQAQNLPSFEKWLDDENFVINKASDGGTVKVNLKTKAESAYESAKTIDDFLPEGTNVNWFNRFYSNDRNKMVYLENQDLFYLKNDGSLPRQLTANTAEEKTPTFSPNDRRLAYTRENDLYVLDLETGLERRLTSDGSDLILNGYASWVYYEEILGRRSRYNAFYWSPDSKQIAFLRFDDAEVPYFPIFHHEGEDMSHGFLEDTRYPKAGDPLPDVTLGVANVETGKITWIEQNEALDYTAWIYWSPDTEKLLFQQMNRDQDLLHIYTADPATGKSTKIYEESQTTWVEFFNDLHFLPEDQGMIIRSNRDGWFNLYHYNWEGKLINQVTKNDWRVNALLHVDTKNNLVYYRGTGNNGTESHLFKVGLDGKNQQQLTKGEGTHSINLSPNGSYFVDRFSSYLHPGKLGIYNSKGKEVLPLGEQKEDKNVEKGIKVEFFTVLSTDGFNLPAYWVLPPDFDENKKYPVVFSIYGGPDAGSVFNRYRNYSNNEMVNNGVILFAVDHRASGKFGKKGLDYMHRSLGKWEMHDYIETVKWLREKPFVDGNRMGIQGSSYGGYMAALALTYASDYFTHGISRAPVTDWRLYDNVYTERYMDTPQDNPDGYDFGSAMTHADKLKGKLLIIHGTIDDNVHMQNTMQLISKLQDEGKDFEMMVYPGGRHGWGGAKGRHSRNLGSKFWKKNFFETVTP